MSSNPHFLSPKNGFLIYPLTSLPAFLSSWTGPAGPLSRPSCRVRCTIWVSPATVLWQSVQPMHLQNTSLKRFNLFYRDPRLRSPTPTGNCHECQLRSVRQPFFASFCSPLRPKPLDSWFQFDGGWYLTEIPAVQQSNLESLLLQRRFTNLRHQLR